MSLSRLFSRVARGRLLATSVAALLVACVADPITPPPVPDAAAAFARATTGPAVSSTLPKSGDKGQRLDVHVYGSGFADGAAATWALHGVADPSKVRTNSTTFVSSTELIANITIAPDATIDYWDVQVALAGGKTGVGTELFEVTSAMPVGPGTALGVNDAGDIVGTFSAAGPLAPHAFAVSGLDATFSDLGLRKATAIAQDGLLAVGGVDGSSGSPYAGVWTRTAGAPWAATRLPDPVGMTSASGLAYAVAAIPTGVTVVAGVVTSPSPAVPVYWESSDGTWTSPAQRLPLPAAYASSTNNGALAIATTGDIGGHVQDALRGNLVPVLWRRGVGSYVADVLPLPSGYTGGQVRSISPDGTILAGNVRVSSKGKDVLAPAFWTRDVNGSYTVRLLPTLTGANGGLAIAVYGVTVVGGQVRAVGTSPSLANGTYLHAVCWTWTVGGSDFVVRDIGGVGTRTDVFPYAINAAGTIAVGGDGSGSIKWLLQ